MTLCSDIRDYIKSDLALVDTEEYDSQIVRAIQSALRQLRGKRYWFLKAYTTLTSTAGSPTIDILAQVPDFSAIGSIDCLYQSQRTTQGNHFKLVLFDTLRDDYWRDTLQTERPLACAEDNGTLYLSHNAPSGATFPMVYYKQDATLPAASGTSIWFDDGQDVVREMAMYIFLRNSQGALPQEANADLVTAAIKALDRAHESKAVGDA